MGCDKRILDAGYWIIGCGTRILDAQCWIPAAGSPKPGKRRLVLLSVFACLGVTLVGLSSFDLIGFAESKEVIVAKVNDESITKAQLDRVVNEYKRQTRQKSITDEEIEGVLKSLIRRHLILQQPSVQALKEDASIMAQVKEYEKGIIIARFLKEEVGSKLTVTEEEIRDYYNEHRHEYSSPPKVEARHILLRTKEDAETVEKELEKGKDFGELAKKYSIDLPQALEGGTMGTIERGKTLPALEKALFSLSEGETSDIVETTFGFHILTVDKVVPASFKSLEELRSDITQAILRRKEVKAFDAMAAKLETDAEIKVFKDRLQ
jgi:parvulin-like peptidyl-prolyl isomerase